MAIASTYKLNLSIENDQLYLHQVPTILLLLNEPKKLVETTNEPHTSNQSEYQKAHTLDIFVG